MQTFLPYPDFRESASVLDWRRLGKQRVEALQILNILTGRSPNSRWKNHPAVLMWRGYENALIDYMNSFIMEWKNRGYRNTMCIMKTSEIIIPYWLGNEDFHAAHRSNLLRKNAEYYGRYGWKERNDLPYIWPKTRMVGVA